MKMPLGKYLKPRGVEGGSSVMGGVGDVIIKYLTKEGLTLC